MYTVTNEPKAIDLFPNNKVDEIVQCVRTLISTPIGSVPLARGLGVDYERLGKAKTPELLKDFISHVKDVVSTSEPRVIVRDVSVDFGNCSDDDNPIIKVSFDLKNEVGGTANG